MSTQLTIQVCLKHKLHCLPSSSRSGILKFTHLSTRLNVNTILCALVREDYTFLICHIITFLFSNLIHLTMRLHPLFSLAGEICLSTFVVGFTPPSGILRTASLPVMMTCMWWTVQNCLDYMVRSPWAALVGGFAVSFFFQYVDVALLSKWSFETGGPTYAPSHASSNGVSTSQMKQIASSLNGAREKQTRTMMAIALQRISFAISTLLNFRFIGTPYQVRNTPHFSTRDPNYVPNRGVLLRRTAFTVFISYLVLDILTSGAEPKTAGKYFSTRNVPLLTRLPNVSYAELEMRLSATIGLGISMNCVQRGIYSIAAFVCVACGISKPASWPPFYGPLLEAYSMRRFWR